MSPEEESEKPLQWTLWVVKFEELVVTGLALLLIVIVLTILAVVIYLFATNVVTVVGSFENLADVQQAALRAFSGILLVLLGLELLDTVKVYFRQHSVRVEVILLVGLIAMGRHVLEIDLHHVDPLTLFGFSSLILALAISYFFVRRAPPLAIGFKDRKHEENHEISTDK